MFAGHAEVVSDSITFMLPVSVMLCCCRQFIKFYHKLVVCIHVNVTYITEISIVCRPLRVHDTLKLDDTDTRLHCTHM